MTTIRKAKVSSSSLWSPISFFSPNDRLGLSASFAEYEGAANTEVQVGKMYVHFQDVIPREREEMSKRLTETHGRPN